MTEDELRKEVRYTVRFPPELYGELKELAADERRSVNQQLLVIVAAQIERWKEQKNNLRQREESDASLHS